MFNYCKQTVYLLILSRHQWNKLVMFKEKIVYLIYILGHYITWFVWLQCQPTVKLKLTMSSTFWIFQMSLYIDKLTNIFRIFSFTRFLFFICKFQLANIVILCFSRIRYTNLKHTYNKCKCSSMSGTSYR